MQQAPDRHLPEVTTVDAIDEFVTRSGRTSRGVPIRITFLQFLDQARVPSAGPLAEFVSSGDQRALVLYLLALTKASSEPWNVHLPSTVWARLLGIELPQSKSAMSTVSKAWTRLERRQLILRKRVGRMADITILDEAGSGVPYSSPGSVRDRYLRLPLSFWMDGPNENQRWYLELSLPEITSLLIALSLGDEFRLPAESAPSWYGISADTIYRGLKGLEERGLVEVTKVFKKAPLSAVGYTAEHRYTLKSPFGPMGRKSASAPSRRSEPRT